MGAPTIALKTANAPLPGMVTPTAPASPFAQTASLPKATVSLNPPTQPLSPMGSATRPLSLGGTATKPLSPSASAATTIRHATLSAVETEVDETGASTFIKILSGVGFVAACVVLGLQLKMSDIWINDEDFDMKGDWMAIFEEV
jgi:hypothetical protein